MSVISSISQYSSTMSHKYTHILEELYTLEPTLKEKEKELIRLIESMLSTRPKAVIDESFRLELRQEVMKFTGEKKPQKQKTSSF